MEANKLKSEKFENSCFGWWNSSAIVANLTVQIADALSVSKLHTDVGVLPWFSAKISGKITSTKIELTSTPETFKKRGKILLYLIKCKKRRRLFNADASHDFLTKLNDHLAVFEHMQSGWIIQNMPPKQRKSIRIFKLTRLSLPRIL